MKSRKHKPEQIIKKLREADAMLAAGKTIGQVAQSLEISEQTFHRWRNQYGGMKAAEAKRLKELEEENKRNNNGEVVKVDFYNTEVTDAGLAHLGIFQDCHNSSSTGPRSPAWGWCISRA